MADEHAHLTGTLNVKAEMQLDRQRVEAMPLTITMTMTVEAWRRMLALEAKPAEGGGSGRASSVKFNFDCAVKAALGHVDGAVSKGFRWGES